MKACFSVLLSFIVLSGIYAQQTPSIQCGFDGLRSVEQEQLIWDFEEKICHSLAQKSNAAKMAALPYTIPVVVHIIHNGGDENIGDDRVIQAIEHLNQAFAAQGVYADLGATVNTQIQFCLAKRDPAGNATTGINRVQDALTNMNMETQDLALKNLLRWEPRDYVNIWIVKEINSLSNGPGVAGYAYFPSSHGNLLDGMVCEARFFGVNPQKDAVLIHEMGHYLGLYHTFEGGCANSNCNVDGDKVCDTPPDQSTHTACPYNSCHTDVATGSPFSTDIDDYTGDFMDYSPFECYHFFTQGQAFRMQTSLEMARKSLLDSKACADPCTLPLTAAFNVNPNPVLAGQTVVLNNLSTGANMYRWLENGTLFSQSMQETRTFNVPGAYEITLEAGNADPNCFDASSIVVKVDCPTIADFNIAPGLPKEGETVQFANLSSADVTQVEWFINGQSVGTTFNLSHIFNAPGVYSIVLQVQGPFCNAEKQMEVRVKPLCGQTQDDVRFVSQVGKINIQCMLPLPDGSAIWAGDEIGQSVIARVSEDKSILWTKRLPGTDEFLGLEASPDGNFYAISRLMEVLKFDRDGQVIWHKKIKNAGLIQASKGASIAAVSLDGAIAIASQQSGTTLSKLDKDGNLLWSRRFPAASPTGLRLAQDGSGDYFLTPSRDYLLRIRSDGSLKKTTKLNLGLGAFSIVAGALNAHTDGGCSQFYHINLVGDNGVKVLVRFNENGTLRWARRYNNTTESSLNTLGLTYLKDDGWVAMQQSATGRKLYRIDENGAFSWFQGINNNYGQGGYFTAFKRDGSIFFTAQAGSQDLLYALCPDAPTVDVEKNCLLEPAIQEQSQNIAVIIKDTTLTVTSGTPVIEDVSTNLVSNYWAKEVICTMQLPCPEICDNGLDDDRDGLVDCFDANCDCEDPDASCVALPAIKEPIRGKIAWESINVVSPDATPFVANLNPQVDKIPEILVQSQAYDSVFIFRGDGSNKANPVSFRPPLMDYWVDVPPLIADINVDGIPELILATANGFISVYTDYNENTYPPFKLWFQSGPAVPGSASHLSAADFDQDGIPELYAGNEIFAFDFSNPATPTLSRVLKGQGHSGAMPPLASGYEDASQAVDMLSVADCNGDPDCAGLELVAGAHIYAIDLDAGDGDGMQLKIMRNLNTILPGNAFKDGYTQVADVNLDGLPDVVVNGAWNTNNVNGCYIWDKNGLIAQFAPTTAFAASPQGKLTVANVFDDKKAGFSQDFPEIIGKWRLTNEILAFNLNAQSLDPTQPYWWKAPCDDVSNITFLSAFDFDLDGYDEIVAKGDTFLRLYYGGPLPLPVGVNPFNRTWFQVPARTGTVKDGPIVADVNGDGTAEIAHAWNPGNLSQKKGRLSIIESANNPWPIARPIWNQYNYYGVNVNDDLSIPKVQQKHWLEVGGIGSGKRPMNTHLVQKTAPWVNPYPKAPDLVIGLDSMQCAGDSLVLYLNLCNQGSAVLPDSVPVSFYGSDPTSSAANLLFPYRIIPFSVEKGNCAKWKTTIPAAYNQLIFVMGNDDGSAPRPFQVPDDFPVTDFPECHYDNNLFSFTYNHQSPVLDLGPDKQFCQNSVVNISANTGFSRYRWQDGSDLPSFTANLPGKYWVDAWDVCGIKQSDTIAIQVVGDLDLGLPEKLSLCANDPLEISLKSGYDTYVWSPQDSVVCATCASTQIKANSTVTLHATAAVGDCFVSDSIVIELRPLPKINLITLNGDCDTQASITPVLDGTGPFSILWSDASTDSILLATASGWYSVEVRDQYGCVAVDSAAVSSVNTLLIDFLASDPKCAAQATGAIDLAVNGGQTPFVYAWSNGKTTEDLSELTAGVYEVTVSDAGGCTSATSVVLNAPPPLLATLAVTDPNCAAASDGVLSLSASGGTGGLTYQWSNNQTAAVLDQLAAGTYSVTILDENACQLVLNAELADPVAIQAGIVKTDPICAGTASGSLNLNASGGTGALSFEWSNTQTLEDLGTLTAGTYTVLIRDEKGCTLSLTETLTDPPALSMTIDVQNGNCSTPAVISLEAAGNAPFSALWENGSTGLSLQVGQSGFYRVTLSDANGCTKVDSAYVQVDLAFEASIDSITHPRCFDVADGAIYLSLQGGNLPFAFNWSGPSPASGAVAENLSPGAYAVTITDASNCTTILTAALDTPTPLVLNLTKTDISCPGDSGALALEAAGGTFPYAYFWSNGATTASTAPSQAGTYTVTLTDSRGCSANTSTSLALIGTIPSISIQGGTITCTSPEISLETSISPSSVQYQWAGPGAFSSNSAKPSVAVAGIYMLTVTSNPGACSATATVVVAADTLKPVAIIAADSIAIPCYQSSISLSAIGSDFGPGFQLQWTHSPGAGIVAGGDGLMPVVSSSGLYTLAIEDLSNGCTALDAIWVIAPDKPNALLLLVDSVRCHGEANGAFSIGQISGGQAPYLQSVDNQFFSPQTTFTGLTAGFYTVWVKDANGCLFQQNLEIGQPQPFTVELMGDSLVKAGDLAQLQAIPGTLGSNWSVAYWEPASLFDKQNILEQAVKLSESAWIRVRLEDDRGCADTASWFVRVESDAPGVFVPNAFKPGSKDNGRFTLYSDDNVQKVRYLRIYDRWGEAIFEQVNFLPNNPDIGWDGTYKGRLLNPQVLVWVAELEMAGGTVVQKSGDVTLMR